MDIMQVDLIATKNAQTPFDFSSKALQLQLFSENMTRINVTQHKRKQKRRWYARDGTDDTRIGSVDITASHCFPDDSWVSDRETWHKKRDGNEHDIFQHRKWSPRPYSVEAGHSFVNYCNVVLLWSVGVSCWIAPLRLLFIFMNGCCKSVCTIQELCNYFIIS